MRRIPLVLLVSFGAAFAATGSANAGERYYGGYGYSPYAPAYSGSGYGFAGPAINGGYIGAPFTRVPRTSEIVPPAWGYGTYGIPTATGITQAPSAQPVVYVVKGGHSGLRPAHRGPRILSRGESEGAQASAHGAQVVPLSAR